jgi:probable rRNA maturation factor
VCLATRRRVDGRDGHLDDGHLRGDCAENHFSLEPKTVGVDSQREGFGDRVATQPALRIEQPPAGERREKEVRNPVAELVARRRAVPHQVSDPEHERSRILASPKDGERRLDRVLAVGIERNGEPHPAERRLFEARSERRSLAPVAWMAQDDRSAITSHLLRGVARAVVNHDDGNAEHRAKSRHDGGERRRCIERRDNRARTDHGVALHYSSMLVRLVVQEGPHEGVSGPELRRRARTMLDALEMKDAELSVVLTDDATIQRLNRTYRGKDQPTDVLAFAQREGPLGYLAGPLLGDVVLSVPTARRQARARRRNLVSELTMLLAHGVLHLLGWDHDTPAKDRRMRRETARLCAVSTAASDRPAMPAERPRRRKSSRRSGT